MAQRPKERMRRAILAEAARQFAEAGVEKATLAAIAAEAGTSIGNLYKYFSGKDELFSAAMPAKLVGELAGLLRRRVEALGVERDVRVLGPTHPYRLASDGLLRFALAHRSRILFLLRRAQGTRYASFNDTLVRDLQRLAVRYAKGAYPKVKMTAAMRRALERIYRAFLESIAAILAEETTDRALEDAVEQFAAYHLAGLRAFFRTAELKAKRSVA
jgi:AcrR family transcriptional regulator